MPTEVPPLRKSPRFSKTGRKLPSSPTFQCILYRCSLRTGPRFRSFSAVGRRCSFPRWCLPSRPLRPGRARRSPSILEVHRRFAPTAITITRHTHARQWGFTARATSITASFSASGHGGIGAIATAGAAIASSHPAAEDIVRGPITAARDTGAAALHMRMGLRAVQVMRGPAVDTSERGPVADTWAQGQATYMPAHGPVGDGPAAVTPAAVVPTGTAATDKIGCNIERPLAASGLFFGREAWIQASNLTIDDQ